MVTKPLNGTLCVPKGHFSDELWHSEPFSRGQAWLDLWAVANDRPRPIRIRGVEVTLKRGQTAYSLPGLMERWKWARNKVRTFLEELQDDRKIMVEANNVTTIITILDYTVYNPDTTPKNAPNMTTEGTAEGTAESIAEGMPEGTAEGTQKRGSTGSTEEGKKGRGEDARAREFAEIPSNEEVGAFCASWPGDLSRGIRDGIPEAWWMDWLAYWLTRDFPRDWKRSLVLKFTSDWVKGDAKARSGGYEKKTGAAPGQSSTRPNGWREGDSDFWWNEPISAVEGALRGALIGEDKKTAARLREVLQERNK